MGLILVHVKTVLSLWDSYARFHSYKLFPHSPLDSERGFLFLLADNNSVPCSRALQQGQRLSNTGPPAEGQTLWALYRSASSIKYTVHSTCFHGSVSGETVSWSTSPRVSNSHHFINVSFLVVSWWQYFEALSQFNVQKILIVKRLTDFDISLKTREGKRSGRNRTTEAAGFTSCDGAAYTGLQLAPFSWAITSVCYCVSKLRLCKVKGEIVPHDNVHHFRLSCRTFQKVTFSVSPVYI